MRIGIDLGGTKISGILLSDSGQEVVRERVATPVGPYGDIVNAVAELVETLQAQARDVGTQARCPVGVGTPGAVSPASGVMKNCNTTRLNGRALLEDLTQRLAYAPKLANDANCFALSEAVDGAGAGKGCVFGVILGTGVGGGIAINQRVLTGPNAIAGEWGHNPMPGATEQRPCYCGREDCIETYLCGNGLSQSYFEQSGLRLRAEEVVARVGSDPTAESVLERYCQQLAAALGGVINILDPDVIVLGGGLSKIAALYDRVPKYLAGTVFSDVVMTPILPPVFGDDSGVRGAAWL